LQEPTGLQRVLGFLDGSSSFLRHFSEGNYGISVE